MGLPKYSLIYPSIGGDYLYSDPEATMYWYTAPGETKKRTLEQDDIDGIIFIYGPANGNGCSSSQSLLASSTLTRKDIQVAFM